MKTFPERLAEIFVDLTAEDFRSFWSYVDMKSRSHSRDLESQWREYGTEMSRRECLVVSKLRSALVSGCRGSRRSGSAGATELR